MEVLRRLVEEKELGVLNRLQGRINQLQIIEAFPLYMEEIILKYETKEKQTQEKISPLRRGA